MTTPEFDPIELCDAEKPRQRIIITPNEHGVRLKATRPPRTNGPVGSAVPVETTVDYDLAGLAAALSNIPGFSASYEVPVVVPAGLGAVVEYKGVMLVRAGLAFSEVPWKSNATLRNRWWHRDSHMTAYLRDGAVVLSEGVQL